MIGRIVLTVVVLALLPVDGAAHRLDEYLQAGRVALTPNSLRLEFDLTPGANIAASVISRIDLDSDGRFSGDEADSYARVVLGDVSAWLDQRSLDLRLQHVEMPTPGELLDGVGAISIVATATTIPTPALHQFRVRNDHDAARGVYLMNALVPKTQDLVIVRQSRDARQRDFTVEYEVRGLASPLWWMLAACVSLGTLGWRRVFS